MLYAHLYNSPVGDISLIKDEMDLIGLSFSNQILNKIEAKIDVNLFKIIIDQLNEYFYEGRKILLSNTDYPSLVLDQQFLKR